MLEAGQQIQHYRLIEKIGEGGMGVVWRAEDTRLHRHVALKFVPDQDEKDVDRHLREARAASALNHPHICSIHDIGDYEGRRFIVMELLEGQTLKDRIGGKPLDIDTAIDLTAQIADALGEAHEKGIIHRDIKTANIFVDDDHAKMLDFGLATLAAGHPAAPDAATRTALGQTASGAVVGTIAYMSPEQALGKELDARTDIFSLGVVLYEMITGRRAFDGTTSAAVFDAILNKAPTAPVELNAEVPEALQRVVNKALEKDPALRYQSAAGLRADLKRLQRDQSVDDRYSRPPAPKIRTIAALAGAVLVLAVAGGIYWQSQKDELPKGPSIAVLPFVNASGDPQQDYFSNGLTEEIITELTRYPDLAVIARQSTSAYEGDPTDLDAISADLGGVRYILQGSVRKAGDTIRVTAELADARAGAQLWRDSYTRDLTAVDIFDLQDDLTRQVVNAIAGSYGPISRAGLAELERKPPASLDSYDCILLAYEYLQNHIEPVHLAARNCLEQAVERDPEYADAWAWLGYVYGEEHHHRYNERPGEYDSLERALECAERGVRLDPASQTTHGGLAMVHYLRGDAERLITEAERTIGINPSNALWSGLMGSGLAQFGDFERGIPMVRKALALNPHPPGYMRIALFLDHYRQGRYEAALAEAQRIETEDYRTQLFRAAAYGRLGRPEEARRALEEADRFQPGLPEDLRSDLIERHHYSQEMTEGLLQGVRGL